MCIRDRYYIYHEQIDNYKDTSLKLFVNISSENLDKRFRLRISNKPFGYRRQLEMLLNVGLIEINEKFFNDRFSKGYKIQTSFLSNTKFTEIELDFNKIFNKTTSKQTWVRQYPEHRELIKYCYNVKIDMDEYIYWLNNNIGYKLKPILKDGRIVNRYLTHERIYLHINLCLKINFGNIWFKLSDVGRFYSSISNMPSTCLPFLKLYNKGIIERDVSNCQPLLLATIVDCDDYKRDCENGIFYKRLADELKMDINDFKNLSYKWIFFNTNPLKSGKIYECMEKIYKGLIHQINDIKLDTKLSNELQKLESDIFVKEIGLNNEIRKLLRHDSVLIHEEYIDEIDAMIVSAFKKLKLKVKIKGETNPK